MRTKQQELIHQITGFEFQPGETLVVNGDDLERVFLRGSEIPARAGVEIETLRKHLAKLHRAFCSKFDAGLELTDADAELVRETARLLGVPYVAD